jgi:hypothetical protein
MLPENYNFKYCKAFKIKVFLLLLLFLCEGTGLIAQPLEEMEYVLRFGFIKGGKAVLLAEKEKLNKKPTIHYRMRGRTTGLVDKIYEVNDTYESWVDTATFLPVRSLRIVKEQKYRFYDEVVFDHVHDSITSQKAGKLKVPPRVNDLVSIFFYIRQNNYFDDLLAGRQVQVPVFHGGKIFIVELKYIGTETINTKIGQKECYVVTPNVPGGKLFKDSDNMRIYITKDQYRLPIYAEFELLLGALKCELTSYKVNGVNHLGKE